MKTITPITMNAQVEEVTREAVLSPRGDRTAAAEPPDPEVVEKKRRRKFTAKIALTLSLLLALKERGISFPKAAFSISPVTDLRCKADSFTFNAKNDIAPTGSWDIWMNHYIADNDPTMPLLSPLFGNYEDLPPLLVCVGTHEIHLDDCVNVAKKAEERGVEVTLSKWKNMVHAFPIMSPFFPEAKQAMNTICEFAVEHIVNKKTV